MILIETRTINGKEFIYTYSDKGMMIERDGEYYTEAYDPINSERTYTETDIPIQEENEMN